MYQSFGTSLFLLSERQNIFATELLLPIQINSDSEENILHVIENKNITDDYSDKVIDTAENVTENLTKY